MGLVGCEIGHRCGCSTYPVVVALAAGVFCGGAVLLDTKTCQSCPSGV